jgi:hypothetical protein
MKRAALAIGISWDRQGRGLHDHREADSAPNRLCSIEQFARILACIDLGGKPVRLATPSGLGEGRVLGMPIDLGRRRPLALRLL